jgi:hypothetical protein
VVISGFVFAATAAFAGQTAAGDGACDRACLTHIFKIQGGKLHEIEALGRVDAVPVEERLERRPQIDGSAAGVDVRRVSH